MDDSKLHILRENTNSVNRKSEINEIVNEYQINDQLKELHKDNNISVN